jgi:hypothetical protein
VITLFNFPSGLTKMVEVIVLQLSQYIFVLLKKCQSHCYFLIVPSRMS